MPIFTNNNLKLFYRDILTQYKQMPQNYDVNLVYNQLFTYAIESPNGIYSKLNQKEKEKVYKYFHAIFYSLPAYQRAKQEFIGPQSGNNSQRPIIINHYYNSSDSALNWWLLGNTLSNTSSSAQVGTVHSHRNSRSSDSQDNGSVIAFIILLILLFSAVAITLFVLYYMLNQFLESSERIWYNEGWLRAALLLASSLVSFTGAALLSFTFATFPLFALAFAAGISPVGIVITGLTCLTLIGTALGMFLTDSLYSLINRKINKDALDSNDPDRFKLKNIEENALDDKAIILNCAMVATHIEITNILGKDKDKDKDKPIPNFLSRHFGDQNSKKVQALLSQLRKFRSGKISSCDIGDLHFDYNQVLPTINLTGERDDSNSINQQSTTIHTHPGENRTGLSSHNEEVSAPPQNLVLNNVNSSARRYNPSFHSRTIHEEPAYGSSQQDINPPTYDQAVNEPSAPSL